MAIQLAKLATEFSAEILRSTVLAQRIEIERGNLSEESFLYIEIGYRIILGSDVYDSIVNDITPREIRARITELSQDTGDRG